MSIKPDVWIKRMAESEGMIEPFSENQVGVDENGKKTNAYKVTVWHECRVPAPSQTSIEPTSISATSTPDKLGRCISATRGGSSDELEVKQVKQKNH